MAPCILWSGVLERSYGVEYWSGIKFWSGKNSYNTRSAQRLHSIEYTVYYMEWSLGATFWSGVLEWSGGYQKMSNKLILQVL